MAIFYATSTDQYGPAVAIDDAPGSPNNVTVTWNFDNDVHLGDGWAYEPQYFNENFRYFPNGTYGFSTPSWGARRGERALVCNSAEVEGATTDTTVDQTVAPTSCMPLAIPGNTATVRRVHVAYGCNSLPTSKGQGWILHAMDSNSNCRFRIRANSAGRLELYDGADIRFQPSAADSDGFVSFPTLLGVTQAPVIDPDTWYSLNIQVTTNPTDASIDLEIWVGEITPGNKVFDLSGLAATDTTGGAFGDQTNIDIWGFLPVSCTYTGEGNANDQQERAVRDIVLSDASGTYNIDMLGQVFVSIQETRFEDAGGGWTSHPRDKFDSGVLDHVSASTGVYVADNSAFELGSGDFTLEGWWRFDNFPESGAVTLLSKWEADTNNRSYQLKFDSTLNTLQWLVSTDGTAITTLWEYPVEDLMDSRKWYAIAICRSAGTLRVFIDGVQYGIDVADANTYHDGPANFGLASRWNDGNVLVTDPFVGYLDEFRFTKGVARYTSGYTVATEKFGRDVIDDTDFNSVSLLLGFDGATTDESSNAFTVTYGSGVVAIAPDDDDYSFSVLNQKPPVDDSYVEAKQGRATAVLTLTGQPLNTETVTLGSVTYTFQTVLVDVANNVLIGADTEESLSNLIAAVQAGAGAGTLYGTGTSANVDVIGQAVFDPQGFFQAQALGAAGNSLASTETLTNGAFEDGATFTGGSDIPAPSDYAMERLPAEVTGVLAVQFTGRAYKSDAGAAQVRFDLVGPASAVGTGTGLDTDLSPTWVRQVFEEDPDTAATITPSTIVGGRIRLTRTT